jgi:hypothetical protein
VAGELTWQPPGYPDYPGYVRLNVTNANRRLFLNDNLDYLLTVTEALNVELWIEGGRNVVVIGATVTINTLGTSSTYQDNTGVKVRAGAAGGVVHLEGILINGTYVLDGFGIGTPRIVQIQNSRVANTTNALKGDGNHADGIQIQDGCGGLRLDKVTLRSNLQCLFIHGYTPPTGLFSIKRTDFVGVPGPFTAFFRNTGLNAARPLYDVEFLGEDNWMWRTGSVPSDDVDLFWIYPNSLGEVPDNYTDPTEAAQNGTDGTSDYITWLAAANIAGKLRIGQSPGISGPARTEQRPAAGIGFGYVSPGYDVNAETPGGNPPLSNVPVPSISGVAQSGQTLSASTGGWTGTLPISFTYQWQRCDSGGGSCVNIGAATASTYVLVTADIGSTIRVRVTATNADGSAQAFSDVTPVIVGGVTGGSGAPVNTSVPQISGTTVDGQTLTATPGIWTGTTPMTFAYQWRRCDVVGSNCVDIGAATSQTYLLTSDDVGHRLRVVVTASN